jgi:uncharacterized protein (DUF1697 family)
LESEQEALVTRYVAFLRGINVGGHRVKMDRLRSLFEELDFSDVSTFIASGNVFFSTEAEDVDALRAEIEAHLEQALGYEVSTFLRTPEQLAVIADQASPDDTRSPTSHYVIFLHDPLPESVRTELAGLESETDAFRFRATEVHWLVQGKVSDSPLFGGDLERALRAIPTTMRNMNTIRRILARKRPPEAS